MKRIIIALILISVSVTLADSGFPRSSLERLRAVRRGVVDPFPDEDLIAYWSMDSRSGDDATVYDTKGSNDGTVVGTVTFGKDYGKNDDGVRTGTAGHHNNRIDLGSSILDNTPSDFSIAAWVTGGSTDKNHTNGGYIYSQFGGSGVDGILIQRWSIQNGLILYVNGGGRISVADVFADTETWYHVIVTFTVADGYTLYIDETTYTSGTYKDYPLNLESSESVIGNRITGSRGWFGNIDELGIWNRALSSNEVTELHNDGAGIFYLP